MQDYKSQAAYIRELAKRMAELPGTEENSRKGSAGQTTMT